MNTDITNPQTSPELISARPNLQRNPGGKTESGNRPDVYSLITERIISMLEQETIPWKKPWKGGQAAFPKNFITGRPYSGINAFLLAMTPFESPYFLTFKQANEKGGHIRKGEKGFPIIYCNITSAKKEDKETGETKTETFGFLRYYTVFNLAQTEGITIPFPEGETVKEFHSLEDCEAIRQGYRGSPEIIHKEQRAYYSPFMDTINMPRPGTFDSQEGYYATLFHEMTHSTGHVSRLKREGIHETHSFGDAVYSKEELIAEMGAAFLCAHASITPVTLQNSASYIAGWLKQLRNDKKLVIQAAAAAQKAANLILGQSESQEPVAEGLRDVGT